MSIRRFLGFVARRRRFGDIFASLNQFGQSRLILILFFSFSDHLKDLFGEHLLFHSVLPLLLHVVVDTMDHLVDSLVYFCELTSLESLERALHRVL